MVFKTDQLGYFSPNRVPLLLSLYSRLATCRHSCRIICCRNTWAWTQTWERSAISNISRPPRRTGPSTTFFSVTTAAAVGEDGTL